jgi:amicoumacin kinase
MDPQYQARFNDAILAEAAGRFAADPGSLEALDGYESFIYQFTRAGQPLILRIGHSHRRPEPLVRGEMDWINYLVAGGVGAARAYDSAQNRLVELLDDGQGEHFVAVAFERVFGRQVGREFLSEDFYQRYGQVLGRMHALTRHYHPADAGMARPHWDDPIHILLPDCLPESETVTRTRFDALMEHLESLPRPEDAYGLIHFDVHTGNMLVEESGRIRVFDFDDCAYSWFVNDIAIVLFYFSMWDKDSPVFARHFMTHFLRGYREEYRLDPAWLAEIPYFLKLREIDLYSAILRDFGFGPYENAWIARYMTDRKERINSGVPYIDMDFRSLRDEC